jgi:hypothetical protein
VGGDLGGAGVDQPPCERRLQVTAGAERVLTGAGQHADQGGVVGAKAVPGIDQLAMCLRPNAFMRSGRLIVMIATGPRCS